MDFGSHNGVYIDSFKNRIPLHRQIPIDLDSEVLYVSEIKCEFELNERMKKEIQKHK